MLPTAIMWLSNEFLTMYVYATEENRALDTWTTRVWRINSLLVLDI